MAYNCVVSELLLDYSKEHIEHIKRLIKSIERQLIRYRERTKKDGAFTTSPIDAYSTRWDIKMLQNEVEALRVLWDTIDKQILFDMLNER